MTSAPGPQSFHEGARAAAAYQEAQRCYAQRLLPDAEAACRRTLRDDGRHVGARRLLALILSGTGRIGDAIQLLARSAELIPDNAAIWRDLGLLHLRCKRADAAEAAYREALRLDPGDAAAYRYLGELLKERGQLADARRALEKALELSPREPRTHSILGNVLDELGQSSEAVKQYQEAIAWKPSAELYTSLGLALVKLRDNPGALDAFMHATAAQPGSAEAHFNLGCTLLESGRSLDAANSVREALRLRPDLPGARVLYATTLAAMWDIDASLEQVRQILPAAAPTEQGLLVLAGRLVNHRLFEQARECYERFLRTHPDDEIVQYLLAPLAGKNLEHPPPEYVRRLFDQSAPTFDHHLVTELKYDIPREMVDALVSLEGRPLDPWEVLDLGCGTGLVGVEIALRAKRLVGVDLSAKMLEVARKRMIYTHLLCGDLEITLNHSDSAQFDVVTAADVFIYVGRIDGVVQAVHRVLRHGGLFAFSVEAIEEGGIAATPFADGFRLGPKGRYGHAVEYLERLAAEGGFEIKLARRTPIRCDLCRPVPGWLFVWQARKSPN